MKDRYFVKVLHLYYCYTDGERIVFTFARKLAHDFERKDCATSIAQQLNGKIVIA